MWNLALGKYCFAKKGLATTDRINSRSISISRGSGVCWMLEGGDCKMDVDSPNALKRCSSAPQINNLLASTTLGVQPMEEGQSQPVPNTSSNSGSISTTNRINSGGLQQHQHLQQVLLSEGHSEQLHTGSASMLNSNNFHQGTTATGSRESLPTSFSNIFTPRVRRFSASFSPLAVISNGNASPGRNGSGTPGPRLTPRISQLRQEECADVSNSREVNHEREIHTAMQMSQSCEDLTLVAENWSFSSGSAGKMVIDDLQNPLHVALPTIGSTCCSSPSPTSSRGGIGLQYPTTSPSPTRKFVTRRSMSPCPLRPSPLSSSVKRKFDLEDNYGNCYSPPSKKIFSSERGTSPVCQTPSPSPICPSPDSSTTSFENGSNNNNGMGSNIPLCGPFPLAATSSSNSGRITPKFFLTKLSGIPSPGATICATAPFGTISTLNFGGNSGSSSACSTPTGTTNPIGSLVGTNASLMMDCGVSSSTGGGTECRDATMEVSHPGGGGGANMYEDRSMAVEEAAGGRTNVAVNSDSIKMACDESEANISDNQRRRRLTIGPSSVAIGASRELREQVLKSALDPDAAGSCNSNSSNSSSTSSSSSNSSSSNSSSTTSDSNNSANSNSSRMSNLAGNGPGVNVLDSSSSNTSTSSVDTGVGATGAGAGTAATATICPSLTSFPMMAIPSNLAEIAES